MDKPNFSFFGAPTFNPGRPQTFAQGAKPFGLKEAAQKLERGERVAGRPNLKAYWKSRSKEIGNFKLKERMGETLEKANFFLEREEEMMRAVYRKRRK